MSIAPLGLQRGRIEHIHHNRTPMVIVDRYFSKTDVSFNEQPYSNPFKTPMTTIAQQNEKIGKIAVKMSFNHINSNVLEFNKSIKLPTNLKIRESLKPFSEESE